VQCFGLSLDGPCRTAGSSSVDFTLMQCHNDCSRHFRTRLTSEFAAPSLNKPPALDQDSKTDGTGTCASVGLNGKTPFAISFIVPVLRLQLCWHPDNLYIRSLFLHALTLLVRTIQLTPRWLQTWKESLRK
jgi:hypothetical protein